jgi:phosphatidylserine/phosphatidylglycerophosphate/cardiolipin synthase-like enzyme
VRIITDDECSKFWGAEVFVLGTKGIPISMDNNARFHMHNKFVVIDDQVLITGSFNWTCQAVTSN